MKIESQKHPDHVFFLATENIFIHVNQPFKIQQEMIETRNFIPEAFMIHQIQESKQYDIDCNSFLKIARGEKLMPALELENFEKDEELFIYNTPFSLEDDGDDEDEDWDEDEEDWDEEDEDWDEEDEEWDDEDEDWDEDDEEFDEDEDEDWDEDEDTEE
ncbi:MAG TPA: hypothetical protein VLH08_08400 [Acidobacteriota bacterium]|nr:hypothetical protein [Acidobacteriota bacterium]